MQSEGLAHAEEDRLHREETEARNRADSLLYNTGKLLNENREKISAEEAQEIESAIEQTKQALNTGKTDEINQAAERLTKATHKLAEAMYQQASSEPGTGTDAPPEATDSGTDEAGTKEAGEVIDAEFVDADVDAEVDKDK